MAHSPTASSRPYWDRVAQRYDLSMRVFGGPMPRMLEHVAREIAPGSRVLEVAAGTGLVTAALQAKAREVLATDYSANMVVELEARARREGWTNVTASQRDLYALGLDPESFDVVVAANVLHLVPDVGRALASLLAVLKPGGKLLVPTFAHRQHLLSRIVSRALAATGFPSERRLDAAGLRAAVEASGATVDGVEVIPGVLPIVFVAARK